MKFSLIVQWSLACSLALGITAVAAQEEFVPEEFTVRQAIDPSQNILLNKQEWNGASSIEVYSVDDLTNKGNMTAGGMSQMLLSHDGKTAYSQSTFLERYTHGASEQILTVYDVNTLSIIKEIELPNKAAMVAAFESLLQESADGKFVYVQNATPATSVTVVDVEAGKIVQEIPTPGCWGIYPSLEGYAFSTICGDGSFASFDLGPNGAGATKSQSEQIFDADLDPIYVASVRIGGDLAFISYKGEVHLLSDKTGTIEQIDSFSILDGEAWAPGGYGLLAYNAEHDVLFVPMHSEPYDGSHKNASEEIWAYEVGARQLRYKSHAEGFISLAVTQGAAPILFGLNEHNSEITRFEIDPEAKFALKATDTKGETGFATVVVAGP